MADGISVLYFCANADEAANALRRNNLMSCRLVFMLGSLFQYHREFIHFYSNRRGEFLAIRFSLFHPSEPFIPPEPLDRRRRLGRLVRNRGLKSAPLIGR